MADVPGPEKMHAWIGVVMTFNVVMRALESDMSERHGLPINWFDVLNRLDQGGGRLRLFELEHGSVFTRSGMTRLCDRIEAEGLIRRERSGEDRRGVYIAITDAGRDKLALVWPDHRRAIQDHFARFIDLDDAANLAVATSKVLAGADADIVVSDHTGR
jgi:DNA-binding MarR family transcriptional regulator